MTRWLKDWPVAFKEMSQWIQEVYLIIMTVLPHCMHAQLYNDNHELGIIIIVWYYTRCICICKTMHRTKTPQHK